MSKPPIRQIQINVSKPVKKHDFSQKRPSAQVDEILLMRSSQSTKNIEHLLHYQQQSSNQPALTSRQNTSSTTTSLQQLPSTQLLTQIQQKNRLNNANKFSLKRNSAADALITYNQLQKLEVNSRQDKQQNVNETSGIVKKQLQSKRQGNNPQMKQNHQQLQDVLESSSNQQQNNTNMNQQHNSIPKLIKIQAYESNQNIVHDEDYLQESFANNNNDTQNTQDSLKQINNPVNQTAFDQQQQQQLYEDGCYLSQAHIQKKDIYDYNLQSAQKAQQSVHKRQLDQKIQKLPSSYDTFDKDKEENMSNINAKDKTQQQNQISLNQPQNPSNLNLNFSQSDKNKPIPTIFNNFRDNKTYMTQDDYHSQHLQEKQQLKIVKKQVDLSGDCKVEQQLDNDEIDIKVYAKIVKTAWIALGKILHNTQLKLQISARKIAIISVSPTTLRKFNMLQVAKKECMEDVEQIKFPLTYSITNTTEISDSVNLSEHHLMIPNERNDNHPQQNMNSQLTDQHELEVRNEYGIEPKYQRGIPIYLDQEADLKHLQNLPPHQEFDEQTSLMQKENQILDIINSIKIQESIIDKNRQYMRKYHSMIVDYCEEWWELLRKEQHTLFEINKLYKDQKLQKELKQALIYQLLTISLLGFVISQQEQVCMITQLRNLIHNTHLAFLIIMQYIMDRFPDAIKNENVWSAQISQVLEYRLKNQSKYLNKKMRLTNLMQINNQISSLLLQILDKCENERLKYDKQERTQVFSHPLLEALRYVVKNIGNLSFEQAKATVGRSLRSDYSIVEKRMEQNLLDQINQTTSGEENQEQQDLRVEVDQSLSLIEAPYVKQMRRPDKLYTLVLDLDETLIHYHEVNEYEGELRIRPGANEFLAKMSQYYEIMIFTAAVQDYADWAISHLESEDCIQYRLYRQHAVPYVSQDQQHSYYITLLRIFNSSLKMEFSQKPGWRTPKTLLFLSQDPCLKPQQIAKLMM
eukprot:403335551